MSHMENLQAALGWQACQRLSAGRKRAAVLREVKALQNRGEAWRLAKKLGWKLTMRSVCSWCERMTSGKGPLRPGEIKSFDICDKCVEKHF